MLALADLQSSFGRALIADPPAALLDLIPGDGLEASARLAIYRNNIVGRLTGTLRGAFPVVCRLVDPRFFEYAAVEYIRSSLPVAASLGQYGATFPAFLEQFPPAADFQYLPDVAQLEWLIHAVRRAATPESLAIAALATWPGDPTDLGLAISPGAGYLYACYGVDRIWAAHQYLDDPDKLSLEDGDIHLQVTHFGHLEICRLAPSSWTFRRELQGGATLGAAVARALARSSRFDPTVEIATLFSDGLVVGLSERRE
jgi:hypothetical protein